jgi:phage/plasmid-associated DNA primase
MTFDTREQALETYNDDLEWVTMPVSGKKPVLKGWNKLTESAPVKDGDNVGVVCGKSSNLTVIDVDKSDNGLAAWRYILKQLKKKKIKLDTPTVRTGGGGLHLYFQYNSKLKTGDHVYTFEGKPSGIDIRNDNGQAVLPPSVHSSGKHYKWIKDPDKFMPMEIPKELVQLLTKHCAPVIPLRGITEGTDLPQARQQLTCSAVKKKTLRPPPGVVSGLVNSLSTARADGYDSWRHVIYALAHEANRTGMSLLEEAMAFSAKSNKYDEDETRDMYEKALAYSRSGNEAQYTVASLIQWAKEDANPPPSAVDDVQAAQLIRDANSLGATPGLPTEYSLAEDFCEQYGIKSYGGKTYNFNPKHGWSSDIGAIHKLIAKDFYNSLLTRPDSYLIRPIVNKLPTRGFREKMCRDIVTISTIEDDIFDVAPRLIGFRDCVYNLDSGTKLPFSSELKISMSVPFVYKESDPVLRAELMAWLTKIQPEKERLDFLLKVLSTCLEGINLQAIIILTGAGGNGKDCLLNLLRAALGEYSYTGNINVLLKVLPIGACPEVANMNKKRAVIYSEPPNDSKLCCGTLKALSGSIKLNARGLYDGETDKTNHSTNILNCNDIPQVDKVQDSFHRRLIVIPFDCLFKSKREIDTMPEDTPNLYEKDEYYVSDAFTKKYRREFLLLLAERLKLCIDNGYKIDTPPESCRLAAKAYMQQADELSAWFYETYERTPNVDGKVDVTTFVQVKDIYELLKQSDMYDNWTKRERRKNNQANLRVTFQKSPNLRLYYKERHTVDNKLYRSALIGYKRRAADFHEDDF